MLVKSNDKKTFAIIGLPRSGTTMLNNVLNSYENSFCVSEPHWVRLSQPQQMKLDKANFDCSQVGNIISNLKSYLNTSDFSIGGFKETYRLHEIHPINYVTESKDVDIIVALYREPKAGFSAWVRAANYLGSYPYMDVNEYIKNYISFDESMSKMNNVIKLKYEDLCSGGAEYLNSKFGDIQFEEITQIRKPDYIFGDPSANQGGQIKSPNNDLTNIAPYVDIIDSKLADIYKKIS